MSSVKYSQEELKDMAIVALEAKRNSDPRWIMLVTKIMLLTGLSRSQVTNNIEKLSHGEVVD